MKNPENPAKISAAVESLAAQFPECRVLLLVEEEDKDDPSNLHIHIQATMGKQAVTAILLHVLKVYDRQAALKAHGSFPEGN